MRPSLAWGQAAGRRLVSNTPSHESGSSVGYTTIIGRNNLIYNHVRTMHVLFGEIAYKEVNVFSFKKLKKRVAEIEVEIL